MIMLNLVLHLKIWVGKLKLHFNYCHLHELMMGLLKVSKV